LADQQIARGRKSLLEDVCMGRYTKALTERALEMTHADAGKASQLIQRYGLSEIFFYVVQDQI
jgi:hypothetical protein